MKKLQEYIDERLFLNKDFKVSSIIIVNDITELKEIINKRYEQYPDYLDLSDIDVHKLTSLYYRDDNTNKSGLFYGMDNVKTIDVTGWDVSKVRDMSYMFYLCSKLEDIIGIEDWDVSSLYSCEFMFAYCYKLHKIILPQSQYFYNKATAVSNGTFKKSGIAKYYIK